MAAAGCACCACASATAVGAVAATPPATAPFRKSRRPNPSVMRPSPVPVVARMAKPAPFGFAGQDRLEALQPIPARMVRLAPKHAVQREGMMSARMVPKKPVLDLIRHGCTGFGKVMRKEKGAGHDRPGLHRLSARPVQPSRVRALRARLRAGDAGRATFQYAEAE